MGDNTDFLLDVPGNIGCSREHRPQEGFIVINCPSVYQFIDIHTRYLIEHPKKESVHYLIVFFFDRNALNVFPISGDVFGPTIPPPLSLNDSKRGRSRSCAVEKRTVGLTLKASGL